MRTVQLHYELHVGLPCVKFGLFNELSNGIKKLSNG
jgi:hypothetical protein